MKTINICNNDNNRINILKINSYKIAISSNEGNCIQFYNIFKDFKEIKTIQNIVCNGWQNSMCMVNDNILLIGGDYSHGIYLLDCIHYTVISSIQQKKFIFNHLLNYIIII